MGKVVGGHVYINIHGPKNKMRTMICEGKVERTFFFPSALWFLRECKIAKYEIIRITKLLEHMALLLGTNNRLIA